MTADHPFGDIEDIIEQFTNMGGVVGGEIPVDVVERDDTILVLADLPGRDPADIEVTLTGETKLKIEAPSVDGEIEGQYVRRGRQRGARSQAVQLPAAVDDDKTEASYENGVLEIRLEKPTDRSGTEIPVN